MFGRLPSATYVDTKVLTSNRRGITRLGRVRFVSVTLLAVLTAVSRGSSAGSD